MQNFIVVYTKSRCFLIQRIEFNYHLFLEQQKADVEMAATKSAVSLAVGAPNFCEISFPREGEVPMINGVSVMGLIIQLWGDGHHLGGSIQLKYDFCCFHHCYENVRMLQITSFS